MDLNLVGHLLAAGTALSGLVLVFLGGILNTYALYDTSQQPAVKKKYRRRAWVCFSGFVLSLAGTLFALLAHVCASPSWLGASVAALGMALLVLLAMAFNEVQSI